MIDFSKMEGPQDYPWEWKTGGLFGATGCPILWPSFKEGYGPVVGGSPDVKAMTAAAPAMKNEILRLRAENAELQDYIADMDERAMLEGDLLGELVEYLAQARAARSWEDLDNICTAAIKKAKGE